MNKCRKTRGQLPAFLLGELKERDRERIEAHLAGCLRCRRELSEMRAVLAGADSLRDEIAGAMETVDWDSQAIRITNRAMSRADNIAAERRKSSFRGFLSRPALRPAAAALLLGVALGAGMTWLLVRRPAPAEISLAEQVRVPRSVLDDMTVEVARRETLDYLEKSRYLLLDFVQASPDKSAGFWHTDFAARRTRDLLSRKKFINPQLDQFKMAKARAICDQIEWLFLELTQISGELSAAELERIRSLIEERRLLLKINLVARELKDNEV